MSLNKEIATNREHALMILYKIIKLAKDPDFIEYVESEIINAEMAIKEIDKAELIKRVVADYYSRTIDEMMVNNRQALPVKMRQIAMNILDIHTSMSLSEIGSAIGSKDHATVLHSKKCLSNWRDINDPRLLEFNQIEGIYLKRLQKISLIKGES